MELHRGGRATESAATARRTEAAATARRTQAAATARRTEEARATVTAGALLSA